MNLGAQIVKQIWLLSFMNCLYCLGHFINTTAYHLSWYELTSPVRCCTHCTNVSRGTILLSLYCYLFAYINRWQTEIGFSCFQCDQILPPSLGNFKSLANFYGLLVVFPKCSTYFVKHFMLLAKFPLLQIAKYLKDILSH